VDCLWEDSQQEDGAILFSVEWCKSKSTGQEDGFMKIGGGVAHAFILKTDSDM
jgi:hypothetical protein